MSFCGFVSPVVGGDTTYAIKKSTMANSSHIDTKKKEREGDFRNFSGGNERLAHLASQSLVVESRGSSGRSCNRHLEGVIGNRINANSKENGSSDGYLESKQHSRSRVRSEVWTTTVTTLNLRPQDDDDSSSIKLKEDSDRKTNNIIKGMQHIFAQILSSLQPNSVRQAPKAKQKLSQDSRNGGVIGNRRRIATTMNTCTNTTTRVAALHSVTIILCHLLLALSIFAAGSIAAGHTQFVSALESDEISLLEFAPTRKPPKLAPPQHYGGDVLSSRSGRLLAAADSGIVSSSIGATIAGKSDSKRDSNSDEPINVHSQTHDMQKQQTGNNIQSQTAASSSRSNSHSTSRRNDGSHSPQFTSSRVNELDQFLDDMNHSELRTLASGKPLGDLFQPKPVAVRANDAVGQHRHHPAAPAPKQQSQASQRDELAGGSRVSNLDSSQSEQQIYSECALILQRTYVKNIDDPKHQLVPFGKTEQSCISYKDIDRAVAQAKKNLKFMELTKRKRKAAQARSAAVDPFELLHTSLEPPEDLIAAIGEINMAATQIIANQFDLSNDEVLNGLPLINMAKTKFWAMCPLLVRQDLKCELGRYRTITGHCNNLKHPTWGAAMTPFARYLPPVHPDGIWVPRKSVVSEITFHISDGHHETHSNILPKLSVPVYGSRSSAGSNGGHAAAATSVAGVRSAEELLVERGGASNSWRHTLSYAGGQLAPPPYGDHFEESVQLAVRRPHPHLGDHHFRPEVAPPSLAADLRHYQQSHSPEKAFASRALPLSAAAPAGQHLQVSAAASSLAGHTSSGRSVAQELPSARLVTSIVHRDVDLPSHDFTILFMSWGQLLDHDMTRAAQSPPSIKCCNQDGKPKHKLCLPIQVPPNDPFYSKFNVQCLEFRRSLAGLRPNCVLGPRVHQNAITAPIDANFVYGSSRAQAAELRLFKGGRLRARDWFKREGLKPLLPAQELEPDADCIARPRDLFCFLAGDVRANEQTHLTVLHTLYMREHNKLAERLEELNPHWDDERLYQETRHIMAAGVQHVMISEYLPLLIGKRMAELYNLTAHDPRQHQHHSPQPEHSYWHGYDPSVTTSVSNSFAAAAFRQGHTFVQGNVERYNKFHELVASEQLRRLFKQPFLLYRPGVLDELTGGMVNQPSQSYDPFISEDISGHLFQPPEAQFGHDLPAINLQRGRDQGLPGYNLFREWCGLPRAEYFDQLEPYLTNRTAYQYSRLYKHVDDIDLWSGGVSERKLPGAAIGPTFACIIARQFSNTRRGDRFWYENPGLPSSFTPDQLAELRKVSLAKILCSNSDDLPTIQRWALRMAHPVLNPRLACSELPEMNLGPWLEQ